MEENKKFKLLVSGRVQGVGFRYFASAKAEIYDIKGYVRNTIDDKVEIICEGVKEAVDLFISEIKDGPSFSSVENVQITEIKDLQDFKFFEIKY